MYRTWCMSINQNNIKTLFQKFNSNSHLYRFITHSDTVYTVCQAVMLALKIMKPQNSVSQIITILHKINIKAYEWRNNTKFSRFHSIYFCFSFLLNGSPKNLKFEIYIFYFKVILWGGLRSRKLAGQSVEVEW